jgi:hypothetical protein
MFKKKPALQYEVTTEEYENIIVPAKTRMPDWYKKITRWKNNQMLDDNNIIQDQVKLCMPFMDSLSTGYLITLPYDLYVRQSEAGPYLVLKSNFANPPHWRENPANPNLVPSNCYPTEYIWKTCVAFKIPDGYSVLFTHPLNRHDLPFVTLSGIIDGGWSTNAYGQYPFYIKKDFEGLIPQGTPIAQLIPFRNESWNSEKTKGLVQEGFINEKRSVAVFSGWYKNNFWRRKEYN